ncbi:MAG TPA: aldose epimerase family protein [Thermoanaerobaculia bacterium]|nr:aldose epimerase family protein [Thermoanaerobaculia bacterium]
MVTDFDRGRRGAERAAALLLTAAVMAAGCRGDVPAGETEAASTASAASVDVADFGALPDGRTARVFTLRNAQGMEVRITEYGATVLSLLAPDRDGNLLDVVLGFDTLDRYLEGSPYFGATVGRYGNRIAGGRFTLDGVEHALTINDGPNHLHGGVTGFDKVLWAGEPFESEDGAGVALTYTSPDGEQGYPGTLEIEVRYLLNDENELIVDYRATTDAPTPLNPTHHSYFNLAGAGSILGHELMIAASRYTPVDETLIPTGELANVEGTPFDFREPTPIGARLSGGLIDASDDARDDPAHEQLARAGGYDHNWVLDRDEEGSSVSPDGELAPVVLAARVVEPLSGRVLEVETSEPGIQFYSGNFLDGTITGKGRTYEHRSGFCLEPQHFPDSPNRAEFPSTILRPGETYRSRTIYRFTTTP